MIKRLTVADMHLVSKMLKNSNKENRNIENTKAYLENDSNYFLAYIKQDKIIAYALAYTLQRYDGNESMMYLHEIDVDIDHRRKGIGKMLLSEMKNICANMGFMKLFLITNKSNTSAVSLYESLDGETSSDDDIVYTFKN